jgi:hypothetical protein
MTNEQKGAMHNTVATELQTLADRLAGDFEIAECYVLWQQMPSDATTRVAISAFSSSMLRAAVA